VIKGIRLTVLLAGVLLSCCSISMASQKVKAVVSPIDSYSTQRGKDLATKYNGKLESIYNLVKAKYKSSEFSFVPKDGLSFCKGIPDDGKAYVSLGGGLNKMVFNTSQTDFNKRVSASFGKYGRTLLEQVMSQAEMFDSNDVDGVCLRIGWVAKGISEGVVIYTATQVCREFVSSKISAQEFFNKGTTYGVQGNNGMKKIEVVYQEESIYLTGKELKDAVTLYFNNPNNDIFVLIEPIEDNGWLNPTIHYQCTTGNNNVSFETQTPIGFRLPCGVMLTDLKKKFNDFSPTEKSQAVIMMQMRMPTMVIVCQSQSETGIQGKAYFNGKELASSIANIPYGVVSLSVEIPIAEVLKNDDVSHI